MQGIFLIIVSFGLVRAGSSLHESLCHINEEYVDTYNALCTLVREHRYSDIVTKLISIAKMWDTHMSDSELFTKIFGGISSHSQTSTNCNSIHHHTTYASHQLKHHKSCGWELIDHFKYMVDASHLSSHSSSHHGQDNQHHHVQHHTHGPTTSKPAETTTHKQHHHHHTHLPATSKPAETTTHRDTGAGFDPFEWLGGSGTTEKPTTTTSTHTETHKPWTTKPTIAIQTTIKTTKQTTQTPKPIQTTQPTTALRTTVKATHQPSTMGPTVASTVHLFSTTRYNTRTTQGPTTMAPTEKQTTHPIVTIESHPSTDGPTVDASTNTPADGTPKRMCMTCSSAGCASGLEMPSICGAGEQCITTVIDGPGSRQVIRRCAPRDECYNKWWLGSSDRSECTYIDAMGPPTYKKECTFCCDSDLCNHGPMLVPETPSMFVSRV